MTMVSDRRVLPTMTVERVYGADIGWTRGRRRPNGRGRRAARFVPER